MSLTQGLDRKGLPCQHVSCSYRTCRHAPAVSQLPLRHAEMLGWELAAAAAGGSAPTAQALHSPKGKTAKRERGETHEMQLFTGLGLCSHVLE